ncbi:hypothetical protein ACS0TY_011031 [Phlomoides rotata]
MVFPSDNLQDEFFYGLMWSKSITEALITFLLAAKNLGNWVWNSNNGPAILEACEYLNSTFHTNYTSIEVLGRVKKLRSRYGLFSHIISQLGVVWNREQNYIYASLNQWALWREVLSIFLHLYSPYFIIYSFMSSLCILFLILQRFPMARAYMSYGEPLYNELRALFAPDDGPDSDDELIIIVDDEDFPQMVVHALPPLDQVNLDYIVIPDSPVPEVVMISSSDDDEDFYGLFVSDNENEELFGYFDSGVDLDYTDDEDHILVEMVEDVAGEVVDPVIIINIDDTPDTVQADDALFIANTDIPILSASLAAIHEACHQIPPFRL